MSNPAQYPCDTEIEPAQTVEYLRYWKRQKGVGIYNGSEKHILAGKNWPIIELENGALFCIYNRGEHQRALAMQAQLLRKQPVKPGTQFQLF